MRKHLKIHSKPFLGTENTRKTMTFVSCFIELYYFLWIPFRSVLFQTTKLNLSINTEFHGMSTFFRGITKTVPSLFCRIFTVQNFDGNPSTEGHILYIKDSVQLKLRWVKNGANRSVGALDCGAGHSFVV
jgi:hypothetical protein